MNRVSAIIPGVVAAVTGEAATNATDAHAAFLRRCARTARTENARDITRRLETIADRIECAVAAGQLLAVRDAD